MDANDIEGVYSREDLTGGESRNHNDALRVERRKMPPKKSEPMTTALTLSRPMQEMMAFATELSKSGIVPAAYINKPANIFAAIQYGRELGLTPMVALANIAVINGKPSLGTDMMLAKAMQHKEWAGYIIKECTPEKATVIVRRRYCDGTIAEFPYTFTMAEAKAAGLYRAGGPYEKWPKRMLKHRATTFALADGFPDIRAPQGYTQEELDPETGAHVEHIEALAIDEIEAQVLEDECVPTEALNDEPIVAPKSPPLKPTPTSKTLPTTSFPEKPKTRKPRSTSPKPTSSK